MNAIIFRDVTVACSDLEIVALKMLRELKKVSSQMYTFWTSGDQTTIFQTMVKQDPKGKCSEAQKSPGSQADLVQQGQVAPASGNPKNNYRLGVKWIDSSPEKDSRMLDGKK